MNEVIISVVSALIVSFFTWGAVQVNKKWKRDYKAQQLSNIKQDALIYALSNVNHGFKDDFVPAFDKKYKEMMSEAKFIES